MPKSQTVCLWRTRAAATVWAMWQVSKEKCSHGELTGSSWPSSETSHSSETVRVIPVVRVVIHVEVANPGFDLHHVAQLPADGSCSTQRGLTRCCQAKQRVPNMPNRSFLASPIWQAQAKTVAVGRPWHLSGSQVEGKGDSAFWAGHLQSFTYHNAPLEPVGKSWRERRSTLPQVHLQKRDRFTSSTGITSQAPTLDPLPDAWCQTGRPSGEEKEPYSVFTGLESERMQTTGWWDVTVVLQSSLR